MSTSIQDMEREFVDRDSLSVLAAATSDGEEEEVDRDQSDNDEEDGGNTTSDTKEIERSFSISQDLLEMEKQYLLKNRSIQQKASKAVSQVEATMKEKRLTLDRPVSALAYPAASKAAEPGDDYKTGGINSNNNTSAREKMRQRRMSESRASSSSTSTSSRPLVGATGLHARKRTQEIAGVATENMGQDAVNRLLKAKLDILQQDLNKMLKEKEVKDTKIETLEDKLKAEEDENLKLGKNLSSLQSQFEKLKKQFDDLKLRNEMLKTQHSSQQKDVDTLSSKQKQYETDLASRDLKIKRLMEQLEKAKLNSRSTDSDIKDKQRQTQGELEQSRLQLLQKKNKNEELMKVVAKQQELIHVLKRQQQLLVGSAMVDISLNDLNKVYNSV